MNEMKTRSEDKMQVWNQIKGSFTVENWGKCLGAFVELLQVAHSATNGNWRVTVDK